MYSSVALRARNPVKFPLGCPETAGELTDQSIVVPAGYALAVLLPEVLRQKLLRVAMRTVRVDRANKACKLANNKRRLQRPLQNPRAAH